MELKTTSLPQYGTANNHGDVNSITIVLDTVGVDETDVKKEHIPVLVFVFGNVLLKQETQINKEAQFLHC